MARMSFPGRNRSVPAARGNTLAGSLSATGRVSSEIGLHCDAAMTAVGHVGGGGGKGVAIAYSSSAPAVPERRTLLEYLNAECNAWAEMLRKLDLQNTIRA